MTSGAYAPRLTRVPDARLARLPLFPPLLIAYLSLVLGCGVGGLLAVWNGLLLRRAGIAVFGLVGGAATWFLFAVVVNVAMAGLQNLSLALLAGRVLNGLMGLALAWSQAAHVRGHTFLNGATVSVTPAVVGGIAATVVLPWKAILVLLGYWPLLAP